MGLFSNNIVISFGLMFIYIGKNNNSYNFYIINGKLFIKFKECNHHF